jgi:hypothetical protein
MPLAKETKTFTPAPAGTHIARCYGCISLGTQHSELFADAFKVMLLWELPFELIKMDGAEMPMTISKEYTLSLGKKSNLRKHLDSWRGRPFTEAELLGFEVSKVVGAPCQLTIVHAKSGKGDDYAKIEAVTGLAKGMTCPDQAHKSIKYEIEDGNEQTSEVFKNLPEWIRKKITSCEEWQAPADVLPPEAQQAADDNVPMDDGDSQVPF